MINKEPEPQILLEINTPFANSTDGELCDFLTLVQVTKDEQFLKINFSCKDNFYTGENRMTEHNSPLYNQEVFEVFIAAGTDDPKVYWEIEINPNSALWIGEISNPDLGDSTQSILRQLHPNHAGIQHKVSIEENSWSGYLGIPWSLIGKDQEGNYRINFYRIRSRVSHPNPEWVCDAETCDFVCWKSTMSGLEPAFHRPRKFGSLKL